MRSQESGAGKCHHHNQTMKTPVYITVLDYFYKKKLNNIFFVPSKRSGGARRGGGGGVRTHVGYSLLRSLWLSFTCNKLVFCFFRHCKYTVKVNLQ